MFVLVETRAKKIRIEKVIEAKNWPFRWIFFAAALGHTSSSIGFFVICRETDVVRNESRYRSREFAVAHLHTPARQFSHRYDTDDT